MGGHADESVSLRALLHAAGARTAGGHARHAAATVCPCIRFLQGSTANDGPCQKPCPSPTYPQAQQALSVALNKLGELHHLQSDLAAAAELYDQALQLRRQLLEATRQQWQQAGEEAPAAAAQGGGQLSAGSEPAAGGQREGEDACCSAALDVAASCLKLAGARRGLGADAEAEVRMGV